MRLISALHTGAALGAVVGLLAAAGEVAGLATGLIPAYQRGGALALALYAIPLYAMIGLGTGAILSGALWLAGVRAPLRPLVVALQTAGWVLVLGGVALYEPAGFQPASTATAALRAGMLALGALGAGVLLGRLEHVRSRRIDLSTGRRGFLIVVALALGGVLFDVWFSGRSTSSAPTPSPGRPRARAAPLRPNVILIVMDTTRADHLSAYGYARPTSPTLERLASEGARFEVVMSPSSWTLPSVASLMTGLLPSAHGADHGYWFLDPDRLTLAEVLRRHDYATGGFVGGPFCKATFGLAHGFDTYDDALTPAVMNLGLVRVAAKGLGVTALTRPERRADQVNEVVLPWLERHAHRPFFLFINYFDPHDPYQPPGEYARRWAAPGGLDGDVERALLVRRVVKGMGSPLSPAEREQLLALYDGEIAFMDAQIGRLVDALTRLGVLDRSILVLTADHGESFGEHQLLTHGNALYEDQLRVPLILRLPGQVPARTVIPTPVQTLDVFPTMLDLLGIAPPVELPGQSLVPLLGSATPRGERTLVAELRRSEMWSGVSPQFDRDLLALRQGSWKYIASSVGTAQLYNLAEDPAELDDRAHLEPERVRQFQREALRWMTGHASRGPRRAIDRATREQLKALGY